MSWPNSRIVQAATLKAAFNGHPPSFNPQQKRFSGEVVVAQLVERSLPIPEVRGSNPVIGKNLYLYLTFVYRQLCIEKMKIKKRPGMAHLKKNI